MRFRPFPAPGRPTRDGRAPRAALPPGTARLADVRNTGAALPPGTARLADVRTTISRVRATPTAVDTLARDKLDGWPRARAQAWRALFAPEAARRCNAACVPAPGAASVVRRCPVTSSAPWPSSPSWRPVRC